MKQIADEALESSATVTHTVVWRRLGLDDVPMTIGRDRFWDELAEKTSGDLPPKQVDSEHPYLLAYTSGTTGKPKGALHVQGGFLVSIAREVAYQTNVKPGDRIHFATDMGWIMGPWTVVGGGACGATVVYAEGAPDFPADRIWKLDRVRARDDARRLADPRARADPEGRSRVGHVVAEGDVHDRRAVEPATRTAGSSRRSAAARRRS